MGNSYKTSDGEKLNQRKVDQRISVAKSELIENQLSEYGYNFCERTGLTRARLDCSHIVSVKFAKEYGLTELCWDVGNLEVLSRSAHNEIERLSNEDRLRWYFKRNNIPFDGDLHELVKFLKCRTERV